MTEIQIASNALVLLGGNGISSFEDGTSESEIAKQLFEGIYPDLLTDSRWSFATKTINLNRLNKDPETVLPWRYAFSLPQDYLQMNRCNAVPFDIQGTELLCNQEKVTIDYTFRPEIQNCSPDFIKALEYKLASEFAVPLTSDRGKQQDFYQLYVAKMRKARFNDSSSRSNHQIWSSPYINIRRGL